jgi:hypothetical protein
MLRAAFESHPDVAAVPYDVNYAWKWGNYSVPHDELSPEHHLDARRRRFIREFIFRFARRSGVSIVVEKTVSNTLRLPFVHAVFPEAIFVHLVRDGRDVAESARRMWMQPPEWQTVLEKLSSVPFRALPSYATQYIGYHLTGVARRDGKLASWGPRFAGIDNAAKNLPLIALCGRQWRRCVEATLDEIPRLPAHKFVQVRYESLVQEPTRTLGELFLQLGLRDAHAHSSRASAGIDARNLGKARLALDSMEMQQLMEEIGPTLERVNASCSGRLS